MFIIIFQILGGAGLLLYGIEIMKDSLEWISEDGGHRLLEASGKNTFMSIMAGIVVTAINQKSSATTIMVVSLVNAGMMSLVHAAGVIMGANIGTTITAQLLAFRLEFLAPCIVGVAAIFWKYSKTKRVGYTAEIFIGFGIMFIGMIFMESGFAPLAGTKEIEKFLELYSEPDLAEYLMFITIGFLVTALVRSSNVLTGLMIAMSAQGLLPLEIAIPLIMGLNVGKCLTAIWYSRGASRTAKRAAVIHLLFNSFGTILVVLFFQNLMVDLMVFLSPEDLPRQVANAHTIFNLGTTIICIPIIKFFVIASDKLVPAKKRVEQDNSNLDVRILEMPGLALAQTYDEIITLAEMSFESYKTGFRCFEKEDERALEQIQERENIILRTQKEIEIYLVKLAKKTITEEQLEMLHLMLGVTGDIERVSDLSIEIAQLAIIKRSDSIHFSREAIQGIFDFNGKILEIIEDITIAMREHDIVKANNILSAEINLKNMESELRKKHIERLTKGICNPGSGALFVDLINSMEHAAQHIRKIANFVIEISKY